MKNKTIIQLKKLLEINNSILNLKENNLSKIERFQLSKFKVKYLLIQLDNFDSDNYLDNTIQLGEEILQLK